MQVEHRTAAPFVISATREIGREPSKFYPHLSELISEKRETK